VQSWCRAREIPVGGILIIETAWRLALAWYHDRLEPAWRRKTREETGRLFAKLGMTSDFWRLDG
jgi:hypothetical protein